MENVRVPFSIHTLAAAAQGILSVLAERAGKTTPLQASLSEPPKELRDAVLRAMRGPQNFLKHAAEILTASCRSRQD